MFFKNECHAKLPEQKGLKFRGTDKKTAAADQALLDLKKDQATNALQDVKREADQDV